MRKLTENLIQQRVRTCTTDIEKVLQINITGRSLDDVSLLRRMTGVEILSLSFNNITTLSDFQNCKNLKELYLRHNNITDLNEIIYLKKLPNLRLLMLAENPCCADPVYRPTIIRNLKGLVEFDGTPITLEERKEAIKVGKEVGGGTDPTEIHLSKNYIPDGPQILRTPTSSSQKLKPITCNSAKQPEEELNEKNELKVQSFEKVDTRTTPSKEVLTYRKQSPQRGIISYKRKIRPRSEQDEQNLKMNSELCKRIIPTNSNLLSATLKLLKELDYPSLQIINAEVASRIDTFETEYLYRGI